MTLRKQTLEEWFLTYQLEAIRESHFYNQMLLDIDASAIAKVYAPKVPWTAIIIKAVACAAAQHRVINRVVFDTLLGRRVFEPEGVNVNFPHLIDTPDGPFLIASTVPDADKKSVDEIRAFVKSACQKRLEDTVVAKHVAHKPNTWWRRAMLRTIHFAAYRFPSLYVKRGGGAVSVSSLMNHADDRFNASVLAYGPTALTVSSASAVRDGDRTLLRLGIAWDHFCGHGNDAVAAAKEIARLLEARDEETLSLFRSPS